MRARESLRGFVGDVRMIAGDKHGKLIAEARIDGAALALKCLNQKGNISSGSGGVICAVPSVPQSARLK